MADLKCSGLGFGYGGAAVLRNIDMPIPAGTMLAITGPNGAGKSTLLKCLAGLLTPTDGSVTLDGRPVGDFPPRELAALMAMVPAEAPAIGHMTVEEYVSLGRAPHVGLFGVFSETDAAAVEEALGALRLKPFRSRRLLTLSSGEMQRVMMAQALCQKPSLLLLDEPTAHLDLYNNMELLEFLADLNRRHGVTVVAVLHDLAAAAAFFPQIMVLHQGQVAAYGSGAEALTPDIMTSVFGVQARLETTATTVTWQLPRRT